MLCLHLAALGEVSTMHRALAGAGNQAGATGGLHAIECDRRTVDAVGVAAFDDREGAFAQRAEYEIALAGDGFAVEVGVGDGFDYASAVVGGVFESDYVFHLRCL